MDEIKTLVARSQEGDRAALEDLIGIYREKIYSLAFGLTGNYADAEDLAQEAILHIYTSIFLYDPARASFDTWIHHITVNLWRDWLRRRQRIRMVSLDALLNVDQGDQGEEVKWEPPAEDGDPQEELEKREFWKTALHTMDGLPPKSRAAVVLREIENYPYRKIAATLGCSEAAVKFRINYGREILKKKLTEAGYAPGVRRLCRKGNEK